MTYDEARKLHAIAWNCEAADVDIVAYRLSGNRYSRVARNGDHEQHLSFDAAGYHVAPGTCAICGKDSTTALCPDHAVLVRDLEDQQAWRDHRDDQDMYNGLRHGG